MDDLRDYRFYADDMLHPSEQAINYIWKAFSSCYLDAKTINTWKEAEKISRAVNHRINNESPAGLRQFAGRMLEQISGLKVREPAIDLSAEEEYFLKMRKS
jgi:hypothetical protein